ncbi:MAG: HD domain-containing protein [Bacilli bacterium]
MGIWSTKDIKEYYVLVKPILQSAEFKKRKDFLHHQDSVYDHCLRVSLKGYRIAKKLKWKNKEESLKNVAVAGLLHDFYDKPWREPNLDPRFFKKHGFTHAKEACKNAYVYFPLLMNPVIEDSIVKHMFPLNRALPKYKESVIITCSDKIVSFEVFLHPKELLRYLGAKEDPIKKIKRLIKKDE